MNIGMRTDDFIIAQFSTVNKTLDNINGAIRDTNRELGEVKGVQASQWETIKDVKKQMATITDHYEQCPTFQAVDELREKTGAIDTELERLKAKKLPGPKTTGIDWGQVFNAGNVKLMLLILLVLLTIAAGVSIPIQLM